MIHFMQAFTGLAHQRKAPVDGTIQNLSIGLDSCLCFA